MPRSKEFLEGAIAALTEVARRGTDPRVMIEAYRTEHAAPDPWALLDRLEIQLREALRWVPSERAVKADLSVEMNPTRLGCETALNAVAAARKERENA